MAFATADDFGLLVNRTLSSPETAQVDLLLNLATAAIKGWTRQEIEPVTGDVILLEGTWQPNLVLPERPVTAVSAVKINGLAITPGLWNWNERQLLRLGGPRPFDPTGWDGYGYDGYGLDCVLPSINASSAVVTAWGGPASTIEVTYDHGFDPIPADVRVACLSIAMRYQVIFTSGADLSTGFVLSDSDKALLRRYRKWWN